MKQTHVLILFLIVLTFAAGFVASSALSSSTTAGTGATSPGVPALSTDREVIDLLGEIRAQLVRLNEKPHHGSATPASAPAERRPEPDPGGDTTAVLREMMGVLKSMTARMAAAPGAASGIDLTTVAPDAQRPPIQRPADDKREAFTRSHLLWTHQQVLDRYGKPDSIHPVDNATWWRYLDDQKKPIVFIFSQGLVIAVSHSD